MNPYPIRTVGIPCRAQQDGKQQTPSEKMKMLRDGARVHSFSKKASAKRSTIKCVRHPGRTKRATNQSHNSRARAVVISVTSPIPLPLSLPAVEGKGFRSLCQVMNQRPNPTGPKRLLCVELFVATARMPGRKNAAFARDFQNRSCWQFPQRKSGHSPSSAVQIPRAAVRLPSRVSGPFPL